MEHRYVTESWTAVKKSRVKVYEFVKNDFLIKPLKISNQIATLCKIGGKYIGILGERCYDFHMIMKEISHNCLR